MPHPSSHHSPPGAGGFPNDAIDGAVTRMIDAAPSLADLRAHRLHLLAANRWRGLGRPVPVELAHEEIQAAARVHSVRRNLVAAREAYDGPMMVFKGVSVGLRYARPEFRPSTDIDLLVDDAPRAQAALIAAGFVPVGQKDDAYFVGLQHERPLVHPAHGRVIVEVHSFASWVNWGPVPPTGEILSAGVPSATGIPDLLEPAPAHHALILTAHSWASRPLRRASDLIDIAVVAEGADRAAIARTADAWSIRRLWRTHERVVDAVFYDEPPPAFLRLWARSLLEVRDATVVENHLRRWLGPLWTRAPAAALPAIGKAMIEDVTPAPEETWSNKRRRLRAGARNARRPMAEHARDLGPGDIQPRHKRRPPGP